MVINRSRVQELEEMQARLAAWQAQLQASK